MKLFEFLKRNQDDIILIIGVILVSLISFAIGWTFGVSSNIPSNQSNIEIKQLNDKELKAYMKENASQKEKIGEKQNADNKEIKIVGSENGEVYHLPWCPGAKQIKEENKIFFKSKKEAENRGYRPAKNCPGLKK